MKKKSNPVKTSDGLHKSSLPKEAVALFKAALKAQKNAQAPYSGYLIGSGVRMKNGKVFGGCNVENASYGGTVCAERNAIFSAVAASGSQAIQEILVISNEKIPWPPCGFCRQVIAEFALPTTQIFAANPQGHWKMWLFKDLMPEAFTPEHLK